MGSVTLRALRSVHLHLLENAQMDAEQANVEREVSKLERAKAELERERDLLRQEHERLKEDEALLEQVEQELRTQKATLDQERRQLSLHGSAAPALDAKPASMYDDGDADGAVPLFGPLPGSWGVEESSQRREKPPESRVWSPEEGLRPGVSGVSDAGTVALQARRPTASSSGEPSGERRSEVVQDRVEEAAKDGSKFHHCWSWSAGTGKGSDGDALDTPWGGRRKAAGSVCECCKPKVLESQQGDRSNSGAKFDVTPVGEGVVGGPFAAPDSAAPSLLPGAKDPILGRTSPGVLVEYPLARSDSTDSLTPTDSLSSQANSATYSSATDDSETVSIGIVNSAEAWSSQSSQRTVVFGLFEPLEKVGQERKVQVVGFSCTVCGLKRRSSSVAELAPTNNGKATGQGEGKSRGLADQLNKVLVQESAVVALIRRAISQHKAVLTRCDRASQLYDSLLVQRDVVTAQYNKVLMLKRQIIDEMKSFKAERDSLFVL